MPSRTSRMTSALPHRGSIPWPERNSASCANWAAQNGGMELHAIFIPPKEERIGIVNNNMVCLKLRIGQSNVLSSLLRNYCRGDCILSEFNGGSCVGTDAAHILFWILPPADNDPLRQMFRKRRKVPFPKALMPGLGLQERKGAGRRHLRCQLPRTW